MRIINNLQTVDLNIIIKSINILLFTLFSIIPLYSENVQENIKLLLITESDISGLSEYENTTINIYSDYMLDSGITAVPYKDKSGKTTEVYCSEASSKKMDFVALNRISMNSEIITINSTVYNSSSGEKIFEASSSGSINLGLEKKLIFLASQSSAVIKEKALKQESKSNIQDSLIAEAVYPPVNENQTDQKPVSGIADKENTSIEQALIGDEIPAEINKLIINIFTAAVIPLGRSAEYLSPGSRISASVSTFFPAGNFLITPGLYTAFSSFKAEGAIRETDNTLIDFGIDFTVSIPGKSRYIPYASLAAGFSLFGVSDDSDQGKWKTIPSGGLAIGSDFLITPDIGIKASCGSNIYIESSLLIITFQPSLGGRFSW